MGSDSDRLSLDGRGRFCFPVTVQAMKAGSIELLTAPSATRICRMRFALERIVPDAGRRQTFWGDRGEDR
jgi:hypothetical protein